jgi:RimJ/RimL family protein N-acetyltransferase
MTSPPPPLAPVLSDGVVTLRSHSRQDAEAVFEQCTDPEMQRWTMAPTRYTRDDALGYVTRAAAAWADPAGLRPWAVEWRGGGPRRFAGSIDLRPGATPEVASIGFGLHPAARGAGVMSRAIRLVAAHAFEEGPWGRPLDRLHWAAVVGNWDSRRVAWATGFTFHGMLPGTHPNTLDPNGPALDTWHASLRRGDDLSAHTPWLEPTPLPGNGIRLRPWRQSDVGAIEEAEDPSHWFPAHAALRRDTFPARLERQQERMASGTAIDWCIVDESRDRALGSAVLFSREGTLTGASAEIGYQLFPSARGRGVAKEAARVVIAHALAPKDAGGMGLRRLVAATAADNHASNRVLETNGFRVWGRERLVDELEDGTYGDALHWELVPGR